MTRQIMTREELSKEIAKRVNYIRDLYYSVYPKGDWLIITFNKDLIYFNNKYCEKDKKYPISYYEDINCIGINKVWVDK